MHFSGRLPPDLETNAIARELEARRRSGTRIFDLTESNPTRAGVPYDWPAIAQALGDARGVCYEPTPWGLGSAREAVAGYYRARGAAVSADDVLLTASTSEAYAYVFKLLCDPGDTVLVPSPSYPLFEHLASLEGVIARNYPLAYHDGWWIDLAALEAHIDSRTRAIVVVHPNNPTGSFVKRSEQRALTSLCARRDLCLVSDEVFAGYALEPPIGDAAARTFAVESEAPTFVLSGLSKVAALPQLKLGWMVLALPAATAVATRARLELIADTYLSVGTPVMHAAPSLLRLGESSARHIHDRVLGNLAWLDTALRDTCCSRLRVEGGWSVILRVPDVVSDEELALALLRTDGVLVQPGHFFDLGAAHMVVSLLTPTDVFREGMGRVVDHARRLFAQ